VKRFPIHEAAAAGNANALARAIFQSGKKAAALLEEHDHQGYTALMQAVVSEHARGDVVQMLIDHGASIHATPRSGFPSNRTILQMALAGGDVEKVRVLERAGAGLTYSREGYTALLDAIHGRDVLGDARLIGLLRHLIDAGVDVNSESKYRETALRVLSRLGRFDAVRLLLDSGADEAQLAWTPLHRAIAIGTNDEVRSLLDCGAEPEAPDWWERTAWHVAIVARNLEAARMLRAAGVDTTTGGGRNQQPALFYAIQVRDLPMLRRC
jgi:ankyrin repeat protein